MSKYSPLLLAGKTKRKHSKVAEEHPLAGEFDRRVDVYEGAEWVGDEEFLDTMIGLADLRGDECALELGVGTGVVAARMKEHTRVLIGVDVARAMLEKAQAHLPPHQLLCSDIEQLSSLFVDGTFDIVYSRAVLHHVDIACTFAGLYPLLKPGGKLLIAETVANSPTDEVFQLRFLESLHEGHKEFPTDERLADLITSAGFTITKQLFRHERASLQNILASTARSCKDKEAVFKLFHDAPTAAKDAWKMHFEEEDIHFDKRWAIILACRL